MISFGMTLSSEEHGPRDLVANAAAAEEAGFDFVSISDHFHPWVAAQGHSPFVWSVRLRWWVCHPGWDEHGIDVDARDEAAERVLKGAQAVERALAAFTCGRTPEGVQSWRITDARSVPPAAQSAGWEWTVRTVQ